MALIYLYLIAHHRKMSNHTRVREGNREHPHSLTRYHHHPMITSLVYHNETRVSMLIYRGNPAQYENNTIFILLFYTYLFLWLNSGVWVTCNLVESFNNPISIHNYPTSRKLIHYFNSLNPSSQKQETRCPSIQLSVRISARASHWKRNFPKKPSFCHNFLNHLFMCISCSSACRI